MIRYVRVVGACLIAVLPSFLKRPLYRWLWGYIVGRDVRIGLSVLIDVERCSIGAGTRIGHFNIFTGIRELEIGEHVRIGFMNVIRGGERVSIGSFATLLRRNVLNSIPDAERANPGLPHLELGAGCVLTDGHRLDFTDRITIGSNTIVGGRNSSFWTHNRQQTRPIAIGTGCYLGSEVRAAPGVEIADHCIIALGSVLFGQYPDPHSLIVGNPAVVKRALREHEIVLVTHPTRSDLPADLLAAPHGEG